MLNSVNVDPKTLEILGLTNVQCSSSVSDIELFQLFKELKKEHSAHTWQKIENLTPSNCFEKLNAFEQSLRPTRFFFYFGAFQDGRKELVGIGTIADKISHRFPVAGFPVLARCFILKKYRNNRLYEPILRHRYDYCLKEFGDTLKGIHLGSQSPKIYQVIKNHIFPLPFIYIGNELLKLGNHSEFVRDYLCFTENYKNQVQSELDAMADSFSTDSYKKVFSQLFHNEFSSDSYGHLLSIIKTDYISPFPIKNKYPSIAILLEMFESVGVISDPQEFDEVSQINTLRRAS